MIEIELSEKIKNSCPEMTLGVLFGEVKNSLTSDAVWEEMGKEIKLFKETYSLGEINKRNAIASTRKLYKKLGKDPNRYRPSAESLSRRIVRELPLYKVNTIVDIINIVSIKYAYSIGGFDADKIQGNIRQGVGNAEEEFNAIGRGQLNVEGLPILRDEIGGIGTPTSDHERTKITLDTTKLLIVINAYDGTDGVKKTAEELISLLKNHASLANYTLNYLK